jgi:hypothetical protein
MRYSADFGPLIVLIEPRGLAILGMAWHDLSSFHGFHGFHGMAYGWKL